MGWHEKGTQPLFNKDQPILEWAPASPFRTENAEYSLELIS